MKVYNLTIDGLFGIYVYDDLEKLLEIVEPWLDNAEGDGFYIKIETDYMDEEEFENLEDDDEF